MNLNNIATYLNLSQKFSGSFNHVCIDSRKILPGDLFVALRGERFDGHAFIDVAVAGGAVAVLCERNNPKINVPQLVVDDTSKALTLIAKEYCKTLTCQIIAVTGSNGKTTVKEMIAAILPQPAYATPGNFNNHIGVPLTVLNLKPEHRFAVIELGASHRGEIANTVAIIQPKVALVNNIAPAHIEGFGSIDGVVAAKGEIYQGLGQSGHAVVNDDDNYAHAWDKLLQHVNVIRFSQKKSANLFASDISFENNGCASFTLNCSQDQAQVKLNVPGAHNIQNALAAAACCYAVNISLENIVDGLMQFTGVSGRMTYLLGKQQARIIDDTYNANLHSALVAINVLAQQPGTRILVLGDLSELGQLTQLHHEKIGQIAALKGIDVVLTCGIHSESTSVAFGIGAKHYIEQTELICELISKLNQNTTVLVKGSRSAAMEKIVHQLIE